MSAFLKVSQINAYLKSIMEYDDNLRNIYISGEISNFKNHYSSGHLYFTLKDEKSAIRAVMFSSAASRLRFEPENGMKVLVRGSISVYERDGSYQIYCEDMMPQGAGELAVAFEQLKEKLSKEGLFDEEHKKPLPKFPKRIGVVTSSSGAALRDIVSILERRYPFGEIILGGVEVQGINAAEQISRKIEEFNRKKSADVLIVGRGGGSAEDLWAFNEEIVARAIFKSEIPVISAVGHETDFSISDFVSDLRAPTPSAAAELVAPDYREILYSLDKELDSMFDCVQKKIFEKTIALMDIKKRIENHSPMKYIEFYKQCLDAYDTKINQSIKAKLDFYEGALLHYSSKIDATSPLKVLMRGYSVVYDENLSTVKSVKDIKNGDKLTIRMADGSLSCTAD